MRTLSILIGALALVARAADPEPTQFARVEIRGILNLRTDTGAGVHLYQVTVRQGKNSQLYHLEFPDDAAMKKSAKAWEGSGVNVTGDLQVELLTDFKMRSGTPYAAGVLRVKNFK